MGNQATSPVLPVLNHIKSWPLGRVQGIIRTYREGDFDFGVDASTLAALTGIDAEKSAELIKLHARNSSGIVNILSVLATLTAFADSENLSEAVRSGCLFDIFDFNGSGSISSDEFSILILCIVTSIGLSTEQASSIPSDNDLVKYSKASLESIGKKIGSVSSTHLVMISRDEFIDWVRTRFFSQDCSNVNAVFNKVLKTFSAPPAALAK